MNLEDTLIAGDSLSFLTSTPGYLASDGWVLTYYLVPRTAGDPVITLVSTPEGDDHRIAVSATLTANWAPGEYNWSTRVEYGGEKYTIQDLSGALRIMPDPAQTVGGYDGRTLAERALDDAKAALANWKPTLRRYRIGDREQEFASKADIVGVINFWELEVRRERVQQAIAEGRPDPRKIYVRLNRE